jgi:hypothetical protein
MGKHGGNRLDHLRGMLFPNPAEGGEQGPSPVFAGFDKGASQIRKRATVVPFFEFLQIIE